MAGLLFFPVGWFVAYSIWGVFHWEEIMAETLVLRDEEKESRPFPTSIESNLSDENHGKAA